MRSRSKPGLPVCWVRRISASQWRAQALKR
jgi:hypothetical protein